MAAAPSLLLPALPPSPSTRSAPLPLPPDPRLRPPAPALLLREGGGDLDLAAGVSSSSLAGTGAPCRLATVRRCLSWRGSWRSSPPAATSGCSPRGASGGALSAGGAGGSRATPPQRQRRQGSPPLRWWRCPWRRQGRGLPSASCRAMMPWNEATNLLHLPPAAVHR